MSVASRLEELIATKESLRIALGLGKDVPFEEYYKAVDDTVVPPDFGIESDGIMFQLNRLRSAKESLRLALGLGIIVPFNEYINHLPV